MEDWDWGHRGILRCRSVRHPQRVFAEAARTGRLRAVVTADSSTDVDSVPEYCDDTTERVRGQFCWLWGGRTGVVDSAVRRHAVP